MLAFTIRRFLGMIVVLWCVITITFLLVWVAPGDPFARERGISEEIKKQLKARYNYDGTAWQQYTDYLGSLLHGDLRLSMKYRDRSVNQLLADGMPVSATLGLTAFLLATTVGVTLGSLAAVRQHTWVDTGAMLSALALISIPTFVTGPLLVLGLGIKLGWLPVGAWTSWKSLILPAITLAGPYTAYIARLMRSSLLEVLTQDFVRTARAKGLSEARTVWSHALKVAILPVVSFLGPLGANLLTGSIVVETIFNIPGAGPFFIQSVLGGDRYLLLGVTITYCALLVVVNFFTDLAYTWLDRRIRIDG
jgi:oligopeptide transport system permease protein